MILRRGDDKDDRKRCRIVTTDYEERVTYRTISRKEFQRRRSSFETKSPEEAIERRKWTSADELSRGDAPAKVTATGVSVNDEDPYRLRAQEKGMTDKLEDIHRMITDMQAMTRELKDRTTTGDKGKPKGKLFPTPKIDKVPQITKRSASPPCVVPVRYRSTILIVIGSTWRRFTEEVALEIPSRSVTPSTSSSPPYKENLCEIIN